MVTKEYRLVKLVETEPIPFELLLMADETKKAIEKYIYDSTVYLLYTTGYDYPVAVFALYKIDKHIIELKNIGVLPAFRKQGIGNFLLGKIVEIASENNYTEIIVGTPVAALAEIAFYEKNGFSKYAIKKDFYIQNYEEPIIEEGVLLRDMQMLKKIVR